MLAQCGNNVTKALETLAERRQVVIKSYEVGALSSHPAQTNTTISASKYVIPTQFVNISSYLMEKYVF